jgi:hypothetical protein
MNHTLSFKGTGLKTFMFMKKNMNHLMILNNLNICEQHEQTKWISLLNED